MFPQILINSIKSKLFYKRKQKILTKEILIILNIVFRSHRISTEKQNTLLSTLHID